MFKQSLFPIPWLPRYNPKSHFQVQLYITYIKEIPYLFWNSKFIIAVVMKCEFQEQVINRKFFTAIFI